MLNFRNPQLQKPSMVEKKRDVHSNFTRQVVRWKNIVCKCFNLKLPRKSSSNIVQFSNVCYSLQIQKYVYYITTFNHYEPGVNFHVNQRRPLRETGHYHSVIISHKSAVLTSAASRGCGDSLPDIMWSLVLG